ncbi:putative protein EIN4-like [Capsicum annuum]|nr:putative protein EIN4-like [Capsicum annuum]
MVPTDYSSVATGRLYVASDEIPGCDGAKDLTGDLVVEPIMEKSFDAFRKILREQKLDSYFRESCFGQYLDLPEDNNARFQMKMVYDLLKHRDINNNISLDLINLSDDLEAFSSYPWGYESFKMTVEYLLTPLTPKTVNLYGFPWAFMIVHLWLVLTNRELKMSFFLTLRSVQTLSNPKIVDGIKIELFRATTITRKIILESGANDAPFTVFETTSYYDYDHNGCTKFSPDFTASSECSACKCQDCKAKHDGVINAINALTTSVKKMTSKRGVIPSKRISYPYTPLEIKAAKRRRKDTSKALSSIKKARLQRLCLCLAPIFSVDVTVEATAEEHNIIIDNPSIASKKEEKTEPVLSTTAESFSKRGMLNQHYQRDCGPFVAAYAEYLSDELQVPNNGLDTGLLRKTYASLLWKYGEVKAQKPYATDVKDPRLPKPNSLAPDEEQLVHID